MELKKPRKIFLMSIDTLRADHLGCYGYGKPTSPNLDVLAKDGTVYPYAFSPSSYTVPVHTSLLTGLYPTNHNLGFIQNTIRRVNQDSTIFMQEIMRASGYATGAFVSAVVLENERGLDWGFDIYDCNMTRSETNRPHELIRDGMDTSRVALDWVRQNKDKDLFVWLHYFDVHGPYTCPLPEEEKFRPEEYGAPVLLEKVEDGLSGGIPAYQVLDAKIDDTGKVIDYQKDLRHYLAGYDNGVRYQDKAIGALIGGMKEMGIYDESMIVVTADHGESLGENGVYCFHGLTVTLDQTHVPLIIKHSSGSVKPDALDFPISTVDLMPTILDYAGIDSRGLGLDGVSLLSPRPERVLISENEWQRALFWKDYCLMQEKDVPNDGFAYYFDSKELCRGTRLIHYKKGIELPADLYGPASELIKYSAMFQDMVDRRERRVRELDRLIAIKDNMIAELNNIVFVDESAESIYIEPDREHGYAEILQTQATPEGKECQGQDSVEPFGDVIKHHDTAVILHLYYTEMWEEITDYLANIEGDFDLFVSIPHDVDVSQEKILEKHKHTYIYRCQNRGRDVAPFLRILSVIYPLHYKYVLKIHTKRSPHLQYGNIWRRELYSKLAGSRELVRDIKQILDSQAGVGIFAPHGHVLPFAIFYGQNAENVKRLAHMVGIPYENQKFQFVAGSMFWFRPSAFQQIINLNITTRDFEPEYGQKDGTLAHAFERFFGLLMWHKGLHIAEFSERGDTKLNNIVAVLKDAEIGEKNILLAHRDGTIAELNNTIAARDAELGEKNVLIAHMEGTIAELNNLIAARDAEIGEKDVLIAHRDGTIAELNNTIAERDSELGEKNKYIAQLNSGIASRDAEIVEKNGLIAAGEAQLHFLSKELGSVYRSKSWRLSYPIRWISAKLKGVKAR